MHNIFEVKLITGTYDEKDNRELKIIDSKVNY